MSSDSTSASSEARELSLISKVELRIALAETDQKLQTLLQTYLAPLLLKLASESLAVRNKVIAVCQHVSVRIKAPSIQLPVAALLKQFKEQKSQLIRHFDLLYVQQGIDRLGSEAKVELLVPLLQGISEIGTSATQGAGIFNLVLRLLPLLKLPSKGSEDDVRLKGRLCLSTQDTQFLSHWFAKLLLLFPAEKESSTCPGLSPSDYSFLNKDGPFNETWNPSVDGGLNLTETKVNALKFLASGAFTDSERFFPALIATADANSRIADLGDEMLKRFVPDLENEKVVQQLYQLYFGNEGPDGVLPARPPVQVKILAALGKSIRATKETEIIVRLIEDSLSSDTARSSHGLQASKLRTQVFTFTTWMVRMGSPSDLRSIAPKIIAGLRDFIQSQGWPSPGASGQRLPATDVSLRGLAYESIGILVPKVDFNTHDDQDRAMGFDLIRWLFTSWSSDDSSSQIFVSIEQALGSILNSASKTWDENFGKQLRPYLVHQMNIRSGEYDPLSGFKVVRSPQYAAVRFANRFLPFSDVVARWIDLMAVASGLQGQQEIVEEGEKGLHPYWYRLLNSSKDEKWAPSSLTEKLVNPWFSFPSFERVTHFLLGLAGATGESAAEGLTVSQQLSGPYRKAFAPSIAFVRNILLWEAFSISRIAVEIEQDWDYKLEVLLSTSEEARSALKRYLQVSGRESPLVFLSRALDGLVTEDREGLQQCGVHFVEICSLASNDLVAILVPRAPLLKASIYCSNQEVQDMATRAFGILASHSSMDENALRDLVTELMGAIMAWKEAIGEHALKVRGALLAMTYLSSRLAFRKMLQKLPDAQLKQFVEVVVNITETARDSLLRRAAQVAISQLSLSEVLSPPMLPEDDWKTIKEKLVQDAKKTESEVPIQTLGLLSLIFSKDDGNVPFFTEILSSLYDMHEIRSPEVHFAVGEALSTAAAGWNSKSLIRAFDVDEEHPRSEISSTILANMCDKIINGCVASKPSLRKASAIWLLSLVKNCGHLEEMQSRLRKCQASFTRLLADRDEVVQESGAQGLSLVYGMGDQELRDDLVRDLVNSFTASGSNLGGGQVNADTELFEPGALPTGEGTSVTTYQDIMKLASEVGDPSLVYRFMSLASSNAIWTNRAAFGRFGISNIFSDSSVNGYLAKNPKIYSKLYRYRFDPNPNVQRSMNTIWQTLVKEPMVVLNEHFDDIMEDLLKSMLAGREWRVRQASCAAIADLIQGRQPEKYTKYINEIFTKAFKVLDDIKETVRVAALRLCQTITNAIIRTLETGGTDAKRATTMIGNAIPFLLSDKGMESSVEEVQAFAIGALIQMIKKGPGALLRPFVPEMLEKFLNSLTSLEPQAVNYIHLNADKYGMTSQEIDKMRLSSIRGSPMMEVIERYLLDNLDETNMKQLAAKLEDVLRSAVGLPSKVGCSRVLVILSMRTVLFRPYADRFIQLLSKHVVDRNDTVSASYCTSMGYLMRLASDDRVLKTVEYAKNLYLNAEDAPHRIVSAEIFFHMSKLSNDRFMAFAAAALPFVFVCRHDPDEHVKKAFEKTWQDNVGGSRAVSLYIRELVQLVSEYLESPRWAIKHTAALAIADIVMSLDREIDMATCELLWPVLEKALAGKTWEGKEAVLKAFVKFSRQAKKLWRENKQLGDSMKTITIREAKRNNPTYRPHALVALGEISQARDDVNFIPDALSIVSRVMDELLNSQEDAMDIDSGSGQKSKPETTLSACIKCLLRCFNPDADVSATALKEYLSELTPIADQALKNGGRTVQATVFEELRVFFIKLGRWISQQGRENPDARQLEPLEALAGKLLFREADVSVEGIRKDRAEATVAYITLCQQAGFRVRDELRQSIKAWLEAERSGPVRRILEQALEKLVLQ